ncbi:uncharacterized protein LOC110708313 [Chenopodium quinoa]|uniref:uncharacterized protein LOC110708313 n=1 Tax=Chenopodium quinoa TaxID=63459 RepID=UPI000B7913B5|nr:uncharacterized protein LOC110708313 [Chenopodium quinoa]
MMSGVWLLVHGKKDDNSQDFDVLVEDTDKCHLMGLYEDMFECSVKQNVFLPKFFALFVNKPRTNRRLELKDDVYMLKMWEWNQSKDTIEIWVEETKEPGIVFQAAEKGWQRRLKEEAEKVKREIEKNEREAERVQAEKELWSSINLLLLRC